MPHNHTINRYRGDVQKARSAKTQISTYDLSNKQTTLGVEIVDMKKIMTLKDKALKTHRLNFYQILIITQGRGTLFRIV